MRGKRSVLCMGLMELVGTALLVGTIEGVRSSAPDQAALTIFGALTGLIYMGFELSGAHYNPAITLTFMLRGNCAVRITAIYTAMQLAGGFIGALFAAGFSDHTSSFAAGPGVSWAQAALAELFFTTALCFSVLTIALRHATDPHPVFGVSIAGIVLAGSLTAGSVSGASFNPAVSIALSMADGFANLHYALFMSLMHVTAAIAATIIFYIVAPEELEAIKFPPPLTSEENRPLLGVLD